MVCYKSGRPHFLPSLPNLATQNSFFPQDRQAAESNVYLPQSVYQHNFSGTEKKKTVNQKQKLLSEMAGVAVWVWQQLVHVLHPLGFPATGYSSARPTCQLSCPQHSDHSLPSSYQWGGATKQKGEQLVTFLLLQNTNFLPYRSLEHEELLTDLLIQGARGMHRLPHHSYLQHYWPEAIVLTQVSRGKPNCLQDNPLYTPAGAPDLLTCEKQAPCVIWHVTHQAIMWADEGTPSWPWLLPWDTSVDSSHLNKHIAPINIQPPVTIWP